MQQAGAFFNVSSWLISLKLKTPKIIMIAPFLFEGYVNRSIFKTYLESVLSPVIQPGSILIMDNASFHKYGDIASIAKKFQFTIKYLRPYCPHLNKIEQFWIFLKNESEAKYDVFFTTYS
jgi:transposase